MLWGVNSEVQMFTENTSPLVYTKADSDPLIYVRLLSLVHPKCERDSASRDAYAIAIFTAGM